MQNDSTQDKKLVLARLAQCQCCHRAQVEVMCNENFCIANANLAFSNWPFPIQKWPTAHSWSFSMVGVKRVLFPIRIENNS
jgi:hypothetical protein